jgi:FkbM family methyltransferase
MPIPNRLPTMVDSLHTLLNMGVEIQSILDVGVFKGTPPLIEVFPNVKHHLFEPMDAYLSDVHRAYNDLDHTFHHVALSDSDGHAYQVSRSSDGSGNATHSFLSPTPRDIEGAIVECKAIRMSRLDTLLKEVVPTPPFLLKIDVDGHELNILRGATSTLHSCSVVIIEATKSNLVERALFMQRNDFFLFDVVDLSYYAGAFWQADLVFVRSELAKENKKLIPMEARESLDRSSWYTFTALG